MQNESCTFIKRNVYNLFGQLYDIHTQLHMIHTEQQTKPFLRHCLQQFTALFISVNTIFLHNTPFDETTKIAKYSQKSHSNAFQLFSKHRNDLTPFKLFPRLILFQLIQPVDNLLGSTAGAMVSSISEYSTGEPVTGQAGTCGSSLGKQWSSPECYHSLKSLS